MKVSELMRELQKIKAKHGDIEVKVWDEVEDQPVRRVKVRDAVEGKKPKPAHVVIE